MIDKSGEWWKGDAYNDLVEYVTAFCDYNYRADEIRQSVCRQCQGTVFGIVLDDAEGCAQRVCRSCRSAEFIGDSAEYWEDADVGEAACLCGAGNFEVAVAFSLMPERREVRWITVAGRCLSCNLLGAYVDWKVNYEPSGHLLELS